jgi:SOS-response transcriptional repressor LexA
MENKEMRRANMLALAKQLGSLKALADATGVPAAYLSQIKNKYQARGMGDDVARRIEKALKKSTGWMDHQHGVDRNLSEATTIGGAPLLTWDNLDANLRAGPDHLLVTDWIPKMSHCGPSTFALAVIGESMRNPGGKPSYEEGEILLVDPEVTPKTRDRVVVLINGDNTPVLRQIIIEGGRRFVRALNPAWPQGITEIRDNTKIYGVVVGKWVPEQ